VDFGDDDNNNKTVAVEELISGNQTDPIDLHEDLKKEQGGLDLEMELETESSSGDDEGKILENLKDEFLEELEGLSSVYDDAAAAGDSLEGSNATVTLSWDEDLEKPKPTMFDESSSSLNENAINSLEDDFLFENESRTTNNDSVDDYEEEEAAEGEDINCLNNPMIDDDDDIEYIASLLMQDPSQSSSPINVTEADYDNKIDASERQDAFGKLAIAQKTGLISSEDLVKYYGDECEDNSAGDAIAIEGNEEEDQKEMKDLAADTDPYSSGSDMLKTENDEYAAIDATSTITDGDKKSTSEEFGAETATVTLKNNSSISLPSLVDAVQKVGSVISSTISSTLQPIQPVPPIQPPTLSNIENNHETTVENLSQINIDLQNTLQSQKKNMGQLRRKIHDLEGKLLRANRKKWKGMEDEINTRMIPFREACEKEVSLANETIAQLMMQVEALSNELEERKETMEKQMEDRERVAAEYTYVAKSYTEIKRKLDSRTQQWQTDLDNAKQQISSLEQQLSDTTALLQQAQKETKQWKDECTNKANLLESTTIRLSKLQSEIDQLQSYETQYRASASQIEQLEKELMQAQVEATNAEEQLQSLQKELRDQTQNTSQMIVNAREEEKFRSKDNLSILSMEYEELLEKKSKKVKDFRVLWRQSQSKRRKLEREFENVKKIALEELKNDMMKEMEMLKTELASRPNLSNDEVEEEKKRLMAEIESLTKSFEDIQSELASNSKTYQECIDSYESEAAELKQTLSEKDRVIQRLELESNATVERASLLEWKVGNLTQELQEERSQTKNLTASFNSLEADLKAARSNSTEAEGRLTALKDELKSYQTQLLEKDKSISELEKEAHLLAKTQKSTPSHDILKAKDAKISQLNRDLEEKSELVDVAKRTVEEVKLRFKQMTAKFDTEKERSTGLAHELRSLKEMLLSEKDAKKKLQEDITAVQTQLGDESQIAKKYRERITTLESKVQLATQQLLLSNRLVNEKQDDVTRLNQQLTDTLTSLAAAKEISSSPTEKDNFESRLLRAKANERILLAELNNREQTIEKESIIQELKAKLAEAKSESRLVKAKSNEKIILSKQLLIEKEKNIIKLQNKAQEANIFNEISGQNTTENVSSSSEISELKASQTKAKEKLRLKNRALMEKEEVITKLKADIEDLNAENENITERWKQEIQSNDNLRQNHEQQLQSVEDRLTLEHIAKISKIEEEMNETVYQLEMEIKSLNKKIANNEALLERNSMGVEAGYSEISRLQHLEETVREGKQNEISLLKQNMMLKKVIEDLKEKQKKALAVASQPVITENGNDEELPSYYKEKKKSLLRRVASGVWSKLRRKKL